MENGLTGWITRRWKERHYWRMRNYKVTYHYEDIGHLKFIIVMSMLFVLITAIGMIGMIAKWLILGA